MTTNESNALLPPIEVSRLLHVSVGTLAVWRCEKRYALKFVRIGRKILYRASDIEAFIKARTQPGVAQDSRPRAPRRRRERAA
jgi:hypothetical protein